MADFVKVTLIEGANEDGSGGTVVDSPSAKMPDGHLQLILQSFAAVHGITRKTAAGDVEEMSLGRNYTYRVREYTEQVVRAAAIKQAKAAAEAAAGADADAKLGSVEVVE